MSPATTRPAEGRSDTRLVCRTCRAGTAIVSRAQQKLRRGGKKVTHVHVECSNLACRHEWWSRAKAALEIGRLLDAQARIETTL